MVARAELGIRADVVEFSTDDDGGLEPVALQDRGHHRSGRGLAVRPRHGHPDPLLHQVAEHLPALHDGQAGFLGSQEFRVVGRDRRGDHQDVGPANVLG